MSADLEIFATRDVPLAELRERLPRADAWDDYGGELAHAGDGWQVLVGEAEPIELEDVPEDLRSLAEPRYLVPVTLEPIGADEAGYAFLADVVGAVAAAVDGVGYDPRTGAPRRFGSEEAK